MIYLTDEVNISIFVGTFDQKYPFRKEHVSSMNSSHNVADIFTRSF